MLAPAAFAAETVQYAYDAAGRLTQADYGGARIDCVYDANGNLLQWTVTAGGAVTYTLQATTNLVTAPWVDVPGQGPRPGAGGADEMSAASASPARFYRVKVAVP